MELTKISPNVPIKAIPDQKLNEAIITHFVPWISGLLSLTGETSTERLEIALPAIKTHAWSMSFQEIKTMFEMYADNKLSITPIPNYFDRILFGKIVEAYKQQLQRKEVKIEAPKMTDEEKQILVYTGIMNCYEHYLSEGDLLSGYSYVYDHFYPMNKFPKHDKEYRSKINELAVKSLTRQFYKNEARTTSIGKYLKEIRSDGSLRIRCKEIILTQWFDKLIEKGIEIKNEL